VRAVAADQPSDDDDGGTWEKLKVESRNLKSNRKGEHSTSNKATMDYEMLKAVN